MACTVLRPTGPGGGLSSTLGSRAVRPASACREISSPGAMAPPRYSPAALMASKVVPVPKSMMQAGAP